VAGASTATRSMSVRSLFDTNIIVYADDLHSLHGINFWDALLLRSAKQTGCKILFAEDIQTDHEMDGVEIVNPFL